MYNTENQWLPSEAWLSGYDRNGNLVQQRAPDRLFTYDAFNRLRSGADTVLQEKYPGCVPNPDQLCYNRGPDASTSTITYDALNRRVSRTVTAGLETSSERHVYRRD